MDKYPEFASLLLDLLQPSTSRELRGKALETIAYICGSPAKKLSTFNRSGMVDRVMSAVRDLCNRGEVEGYEVLAQLLEFHPEGEQQELEMELNKKLLRFCDADYVSKLSDRIKQPFEALAKAAHLGGYLCSSVAAFLKCSYFTASFSKFVFCQIMMLYTNFDVTYLLHTNSVGAKKQNNTLELNDMWNEKIVT